MLDERLVQQIVILYRLPGSGIEDFLLQLRMDGQLLANLLRQFFLPLLIFLFGQFFVFPEQFFSFAWSSVNSLIASFFELLVVLLVEARRVVVRLVVVLWLVGIKPPKVEMMVE